jgi:roadblock/LC7 domain-containing protein
MVQLDELFQLDGVTAIAKLDDMGRIVDWKAKGAVSHDLKEAMGTFINSIMTLMEQQARVAPRNWHPRRYWVYSGGDMTMIAAGQNAAIMETAKADMNSIFNMFGIL